MILFNLSPECGKAELSLPFFVSSSKLSARRCQTAAMSLVPILHCRRHQTVTDCCASSPARLSSPFVYTLFCTVQCTVYSEAALDFQPLLPFSSLVHTPTNNHPWIFLIQGSTRDYLSTCSQHLYYRMGAAKKWIIFYSDWNEMSVTARMKWNSF